MTSVTLGSRVWINGALLDASSAVIPITDRGFTLGDGLFETMLWTGTKIRFFADHLTRLANSGDELGFALPMPIEDIERALIALAADAQGTLAALRVTLTRGGAPRGLAIPVPASPLLMATIAPFVKPVHPVSLKTVVTTRHAGAPSARFKTLSYIDNIVALDQARKGGAHDAIMLSTTGHVACASSANLVIRLKGRILTPAVEDGALPGIVRGRLLKAGLVGESHITPAQLALCDGAVLTNALIGVRPVGIIDGRSIMTENVWVEAMIDALK
jgi:branched-chain amino acid aminotransferase